MNDNVIMVRKQKVGIGAIIYAVYCAIIPLNMVLNFTGFTINKYIAILVIFFFTIEIFARRAYHISKHCVPFIIFVIWCFITVLWSIKIDRTISQLNTLFGLLVVFLLGLVRGFNKREIELIKIAAIVVAVAVLFWLAPNLSVSYTRATLTSRAGVADQNGLAANLLFVLWYAIDEVVKKQKSWKLFYLICAIIITLELLLIASRGAIMALAISLIVYNYIKTKRSAVKLSRKKTIVLLVVIPSLLMILFIRMNSIIDWFFVRFPATRRLGIQKMIADGGMGRTKHWKNALKMIFDSPIKTIFGYGFGCEGEVLKRANDGYSGIHNVFLEYWVTTGLIGLLLLVVLFWKLAQVALKNKDDLSVALVFALATVCFFLGFFLDKGTWNVFLMVLCGIGIGQQEGGQHDRDFEQRVSRKKW